MTSVRSKLLLLLPLLGVGSCYKDAPPQQSTFPEPYYVAGPPGGASDPVGPGATYGPPARDPAPRAVSDATDDRATEGDPSDSDPDPADDDDDSDGASLAPGQPGAALSGGELPPGPGPGPGTFAPGDPGNPAGPADPTATVTDAEINAALHGYGQWIETPDYGEVWRPDATAVGVDFTPYSSGGSWEYTDAGWAFASDYSWGWLPFHYGRWGWFDGSWGWVPGRRWGPAWVDWRHGGGVVGWRPRPPTVRDHRGGSGSVVVRDHRSPRGTAREPARLHDAHWQFAAVSDFGRPHIRSHLYGNLAENLRVTSPVAAPPVRARTTVRTADLMSNRFASGARFQPPRAASGPQQVRDHRLPSQDRDRTSLPPAAWGPSTRGAGRVYQPPARAYQPPARAYQPPARAYQPPARAYQPPARAYQPPARSYQPPARAYQPARGYPSPATSPMPSRSWSAPVPPARPAPARTWSAPSAPPARPAPARSWSAPASTGSSRSSPPSSSGHSGGGHRR